MRFQSLVPRIIVLAGFVLTISAVGYAQIAPPSKLAAIPAASAQGQAGKTEFGCANGRFDPELATRQYLATVPADVRARSDAYFEGGYWFMLWDFLSSAAAFLIVLGLGWSARMRDFAERISRFKPVQTFLYWAQFFIVVSVITFPLTYYEGYVREHAYGLATQTFGPWLGDQAKGLVLGIILGGILVIFLYGVLRRAPRTWWLWGAVTFILFMIFVVLISPVYIAPIFNKYTKLTDPTIREPILSMARANGIPATDVYVVDASRQSTRISANVSGFLGTERITLNDNLLKRCSLEEIESVMGHEMGHYVMHHVYKDMLFFAVLIVIGFVLIKKSSDAAIARWGAAWRVRGVEDLAALPLLAFLLMTYFFVLTPITNNYSRAEEYEADIFGLNAARQPDGEATVDLKLADYRKLDPGPIEEWLFYDHPSGRDRIYAAMRWKAKNLTVPCPPATAK